MSLYVDTRRSGRGKRGRPGGRRTSTTEAERRNAEIKLIARSGGRNQNRGRS